MATTQASSSKASPASPHAPVRLPPWDNHQGRSQQGMSAAFAPEGGVVSTDASGGSAGTSRRSHLERPLVFQCADCRHVLGDSTALVAIRKDLRVVVTSSVTEDVALGKELETSREPGPELGSTYLQMSCGPCGVNIGRVYKTTSAVLDDLRESYSLELGKISLYQLGTMQRHDQLVPRVCQGPQDWQPEDPSSAQSDSPAGGGSPYDLQIASVVPPGALQTPTRAPQHLRGDAPFGGPMAINGSSLPYSVRGRPMRTPSVPPAPPSGRGSVTPGPGGLGGPGEMKRMQLLVMAMGERLVELEKWKQLQTSSLPSRTESSNRAHPRADILDRRGQLDSTGPTARPAGRVPASGSKDKQATMPSLGEGSAAAQSPRMPPPSTVSRRNAGNASMTGTDSLQVDQMVPSTSASSIGQRAGQISLVGDRQQEQVPNRTPHRPSSAQTTPNDRLLAVNRRAGPLDGKRPRQAETGVAISLAEDETDELDALRGAGSGRSRDSPTAASRQITRGPRQVTQTVNDDGIGSEEVLDTSFDGLDGDESEDQTSSTTTGGTGAQSSRRSTGRHQPSTQQQQQQQQQQESPDSQRARPGSATRRPPLTLQQEADDGSTSDEHAVPGSKSGASTPTVAANGGGSANKKTRKRKAS